MQTNSTIKIHKAQKVSGRTLVLRNASAQDAVFILGLRTDPLKSRHLSPTPAAMSAQLAWLATYACASDQAYFIIENLSGEPLGTVRIYDPQRDRFTWGSWILKAGAPASAAIESALMVHAYAVEHLGFKRSYANVRKSNKGVWRFLERFGAKRFDETSVDYLYEQEYTEIIAARKRYEKYLKQISVCAIIDA
jgi:RimJ/RimL family protein N-acetyltransferase